MIRNNASKEQDQGEYTKRFDEISNRYEEVKSTYDKAVEERQVKIFKGMKLDAFLSLVKKSEPVITEWSSDIWNVPVESGTVHRDGSVTFKFKNGKQIRVE